MMETIEKTKTPKIETAVESVAQSYINEICSTEEFRNKVKDQLERSITKAVDNALSYGSIKEKIDSTVFNLLSYDEKTLNIPSYNHLLKEIIERRFANILQEEAAQKFEKEITSLLVETPEEYKLSQLIEDFIESKRDPSDPDHYQGEISLHVNTEYTSLTWIYFDFEENLDKYRCDYCLIVDTESKTVKSFEFDRRSKGNSIFDFPFLHSFEKKIFHLYSGKTKFIVDEDNCCTSYDYYD